MSVVGLQQASDANQCCMQSNAKDVVRLIARLLWGTKVSCLYEGVVLLVPAQHLFFPSQAHSTWGLVVKPTANRNVDEEHGSAVPEESSK